MKSVRLYSLLLLQQTNMKTSQTWNQVFEQMRFDHQNEHLIVQQIVNTSPQQSIFESQQIPNNLSHTNNHQENIINLPHNENTNRINQRYDYSQNEQGRPTQDIRRIEQGRNEQRSIRILDTSNANNQLYIPANTVTPHLHQLNNHIPKINVSQTKNSPSFPQPNYSSIPQQPKHTNAFKSFENLRLTTQQSYAPSQKTLVMPHAQGFAPTDPVYHSRVATQRLQGNIERPQKRLAISPGPTAAFQMNSAAKSVIFNSQIPQGNTTNRSEQIPKTGEAQWWRQKCEYMRLQFESIRARDFNQLQVAYGRISMLQQQYFVVRQNYEKLRVQYQKKVEEIQKIKQYTHNSPQKNGGSDLKKQFQQRGILITLLKKQNQQLKKQADLNIHYQKQIRQLTECINLMKFELQQKQMQINQLRTSGAGIRELSHLDRSNAQSLQSNKLVQLQIQNGRLMAELTSRAENHQLQLKLNSLRFNQLADRFESTLQQKDQTIKILQEKNSLLQSDLNKKESLLRNLRDELVETQRKKTIFNIQTPSTTVSAINPAIQRVERQQKEDNKRQMDNMRKNLFDLQRQKSLLNQKIQQMQQRLINSEETSQRRKNDLQMMRRQLAEQQDQLSELEQIREMLSKKNDELADMRQILMEKEQHSSEYQLLSKENQKLKQITMRKNDELSNMSQRLYVAQKKIREHESFNPKVEALEEEVQSLNVTLNNHKMEIQRLNANLQQANEVISQAEFEVEKERHRQQELQSLLGQQQHKFKLQQQDLETAQQRSQLLERELQGMAGRIVQIQKQMQRTKKCQNQTKKQLQEVRLQLQMRMEQLESIQVQEKQLRMFKQRSCRQIQGLQYKQTDMINRKNRELQIALTKCKQQEQLIKSQKQKISKIDPQISILREQLNKHNDCQKTIQNLTQKIANYELNMLKSPHARRLFGDSSQQTQIFQNQIIYQLKIQNENLKRISYRINPDQQQVNVKSRLGKFAFHLKQTIQGKQKSLLRVRSHQNFRPQYTNKKFYSDYRQFDEIQVLTVKNLQVLHKQQIDYYKQLNKSLQQRVAKLIELNKQLKNNLFTVTHKDSQIKKFYQSQIKMEKQRSQRLQKQVQRYRHQLKRFENRWPPHMRKQEVRSGYMSFKDLSQR